MSSVNTGLNRNSQKSLDRTDSPKKPSIKTKGSEKSIDSKREKRTPKSAIIKSEKAENEVKAQIGRRQNLAANDNPPEGKGILKKKKSFRTNETPSKGGKGKPTKKKKNTLNRKSNFTEQLLRSLGFAIGRVTLRDPRAIEAAQALDLQQWHIQKLKAKFDQIDIDGSGNIDYDEFFESIGEVRSPFTDKLFALIDIDGSGTIEFDEYIRVMATYCMFTQDEILRFCFECFDVDKSGTIDEKEFIELCKTVNNASPSFPANFRNALEIFDVNDDGLIDYGEFLQIDKRFPLMLFPAFKLQDVMQRNSLGEGAWLKIIEGYRHRQAVEEYKAQNGGRLPPDPPWRAFGKTFAPCFFREKVHIQVGAEMEARHQEDEKKQRVDDSSTVRRRKKR